MLQFNIMTHGLQDIIEKTTAREKSGLTLEQATLFSDSVSSVLDGDLSMKYAPESSNDSDKKRARKSDDDDHDVL